MSKSREVADYLKKNPEFVAEHQDLLAGIAPPAQPDAAPEQVHGRIHERRVQALRARQNQQQARLDLMVDAARSNQDLAHGLHQIAVTLLGLEDFDSEDSAAPGLLVKSRFDIDDVAVFLASKRQDFPAQVDYALLCQRVEHLASVCDDRVSKKLGAVLFPGAAEIRSCAFIPIAHRQALCGVMVLGAADPQRFQPDMGVLILDRLGQLIGAYLAGRGLL